MKVGKTTFLSKFPKHLICAFEPGTNALQGAMVQPISSWSDFKQVLGQLKDPKVQAMFDTIGIDTADKAWGMVEKHICLQEEVDQIGDIPYGKGYDLCKKEFSNTFDQIARLGYGLVFVSHSAEKKFKDEKGEEYIQLAPALPQRPYDIINKMVDFIGYIRVKKDNATGLTTQKIFFRGDDNFLAGSRFKYMKPVVDFSYPAVEAAVIEAIDQQVAESGGEATNEVNTFYQKEEVLDYHTLMNEARNLWTRIVGDDREQALKMRAIVKETFGKEIKISEVGQNQVQLLAELVNKMKAMV